MADPDDTPGLAHFLEHLLFLGTVKYPVENEYGKVFCCCNLLKYVSEHSGYTNAFTSKFHTNYFFSVSQEHLHGALDRFAQFFIAPLFNPDGVDREMRAVDSEHKKNIQNDAWRIMQISCTSSNPKHPYSKFGTGCLETLSDKPEIRDTLIAFHHQYYSANLMRLVIYGRDSLDQLKAWAIELFSDVPNNQANPPAWPPAELPWSANEVGTVVYAKTIKDMQVLNIGWQVEDQRKLYRTKPSACLIHFLGHEGRGSILSLLRSRGWATSLGAYSEGGEGYAFIGVRIHLSEEG